MGGYLRGARRPLGDRRKSTVTGHPARTSSPLRRVDSIFVRCTRRLHYLYTPMREELPFRIQTHEYAPLGPVPRILACVSRKEEREGENQQLEGFFPVSKIAIRFSDFHLALPADSLLLVRGNNLSAIFHLLAEV